MNLIAELEDSPREIYTGSIGFFAPGRRACFNVAIRTLLLDKKNYGALACGDGSCVGCGEKSSIHLFTAVVTALMQPRVWRFLELF